MWIKILKTCAGPNGLFVKGLKYDLPAETVGQLPKDSYERIPAPWDEHKKAVKTSPGDKQFRPGKAGNKYRSK